MSQGELDFDDVPTNTEDCPEVGIYHDIPYESYAKWKAVNSGVVKWGGVSPKHFQAALDGRLKSEDTLARKLGRAIHCMLLEPEAFDERFTAAGACEAILKSGDNKGQQCGVKASCVGIDGSWYCGKHQPRETQDTVEIISRDEYQRCLAIRDAVRDHPAIGLLRRSGWSEASMVWEYGGMKLKGRPDRLSVSGARPAIIDVKKCRVGFGTTDECEKAALNYGYHVQAAMYVDGVKATSNVDCEFIWLFVEDNEPFDIQIIPASDQVLTAGRHRYRSAIQQYKTAVKKANVHGYVFIDKDDPSVNSIKPGVLPLWELKKLQSAGII